MIYEFLDAGFMPEYFLGDTFTITAENKTSVPQNVDLFSPSPVRGVSVSSDSISMMGLYNRIIAQPFKVGSMKVIAKNASQLGNKIIVLFKDAAGKYERWVLDPISYTNPYQTRENMVEMPGINKTVDVNSSMETVLNPGEKIRIVMSGIQGIPDKESFKNFTALVSERGYRNFMKKVY